MGDIWLQPLKFSPRITLGQIVLSSHKQNTSAPSYHCVPDKLTLLHNVKIRINEIFKGVQP